MDVCFCIPCQLFQMYPLLKRLYFKNLKQLRFSRTSFADKKSFITHFLHYLAHFETLKQTSTLIFVSKICFTHDMGLKMSQIMLSNGQLIILHLQEVGFNRIYFKFLSFYVFTVVLFLCKVLRIETR